MIDSHVHLESFDNIDEIIRRSKESGIDTIIGVGGDLESSKKAVEYAERFPGYVFPGIGVHPSMILKEDLDKAVSYITENACRAQLIGEIGLDYAYSFAKPQEVRERQRVLLTRLLEVAGENGLPVSLHSRSAYMDTLRLAVEAGVAGVFHWYDGPLHTLKEILDAGFSVSATPAILYSRGLRAVMSEAPLERILVETDSPVFLRNHNRRSTPVDVGLTVAGLAELKGLDEGEVAMVTARNTERLFRLSSILC